MPEYNLIRHNYISFCLCSHMLSYNTIQYSKSLSIFPQDIFSVMTIQNCLVQYLHHGIVINAAENMHFLSALSINRQYIIILRYSFHGISGCKITLLLPLFVISLSKVFIKTPAVIVIIVNSLLLLYATKTFMNKYFGRNKIFTWLRNSSRFT